MGGTDGELTICLRMSEEDEEMGADVVEHGVTMRASALRLTPQRRRYNGWRAAISKISKVAPTRTQ